MAAVIVDSNSVIAAGDQVTFDNVISKDGVTYDLTGKEIKATIRAESDPATSIHSTLEDQTVTVGGTVAGNLGGVQITLSTAQTTLLAPASYLPSISQVNYLLQYKVVSDNYSPQVLRFAVRTRLD